MKITADTNQFREAFQQAAGIVPTKTPKEILKFVRVASQGGVVTLTGSNGEISVERVVECEATNGEILLPAETVRRFLGTVTAAEIEINEDELQVRMRCGQAKGQFGTADSQDFPPVDRFEATGEISVLPGHLREAFQRTVLATDVESTRYALGGVLLSPDGEGLELVATDSRRLSVVRMVANVRGNIDSPVIPAAAIRVALPTLHAADEATIRVSKNRASIKEGDTTITARLVEGRFPRYRDVIPKVEHWATLNAGSILEACRFSETFTTPESRAVDFGFSENNLHLSVSGSERGAGDTSLPVQCTFEVKAAFDPKYLIDALKVMPAEASIEWGITDAASPSMLCCGEWRYVVMPLSRD